MKKVLPVLLLTMITFNSCLTVRFVDGPQPRREPQRKEQSREPQKQQPKQQQKQPQQQQPRR